MSHVYQLATTFRRYFKPVLDAPYLSFIRKHPCVACGSARRIEAAHTGPRGLGQKSASFLALPLCPACHRTGSHALHKIGPEQFQIVHGIDFAGLIAMFNRFYCLKTGKYAGGWELEEERRKAA